MDQNTIPESMNQSNEPIPAVGDPVGPKIYADQLPTSGWEAAAATAKKVFNDWSIWSPGEIVNLNEAQKHGDMIGPEMANQNYLTDRPFTGPVSRAAAEEISRRTYERRALESIIQRGPQDMPNRAVRFGTSLAVGMADPLMLGATLLTSGLGEAAIAGRAAAGAAEGAVESGVLRRFGTGMIDAAAGVAVPEGISGYRKNQEMQDYSAMDYLASVGGNAFLYGAAHAVLPKMVSYLRGQGKEVETAAEKAAVGQLAGGKTVDVEALTEQLNQEASGKIHGAPGQTPYVHTPLESVGGRDFYVGSPDGSGDFPAVSKPVIEHDLGQGVYMTDNPLVANGQAARGINESVGQVFQTRLNADTKLLNLDLPLRGTGRDVLEPILKELAGDRATEMLDQMSGKQILDEIQNGIRAGKLDTNMLDIADRNLELKGYNGYQYEGGNFEGNGGPPHNIVKIFDHGATGDAAGRIEPTDTLQPNRDIVPRPTMDQYSEVAGNRMAIQSDIAYDDKSYQNLHEALHSPTPDTPKVAEMKVQEQESMDQLRSLEKQGLLEPEHLKEIEAMANSVEDVAHKEQIAKFAMACIGKDL
jgi:hypothetical protein